MYPTVTAIVVARGGPEHLARTLRALRDQTRKPDAVIVIDVTSSDATAGVVAEARPTHFLVAQEKLPFGGALASAYRVAPAATSDDAWLWLLAQDTAPEPDALLRLVSAVEVSPSVAIAGPKLVDWDDDALIRELGESMTPLGASVPLVQDELDQAQHDGLSDVLGVAAGGMLIRQSVWEKLGGFDRGLPVVDDGLDLSIRARLAGYRVVLVPTAKLASAGDGVAGPSRSNRWWNRRRLYRERRAAQLHRRMAYAPGGMLFFHWLSLVPLAVIRSIGWLLGKQPGAIGGEFAAAFGVAFGTTHVGEARSAIARSKSVGWSAIAPLRIPLSEVRRARALRREAELMRSRGERSPVDFVTHGGAWIVLAFIVIGLAMFTPLLGASRLTGGSLLPLSSSVGALWSNIGYGWRDIGLGFVGAADPFAAVLAVLGSVTFWQPSFVLVLLWFCALPLAALGAWLFATRITDRPLLRAVYAVSWALAPMLLDALQSGRPTALLAHLLLPWLFLAAFGARRSWTASATTSLLAAATVACAPSLAPALAVAWLVWLVTSGRRFVRVLLVPVPALVLFAPLAVQQILRGTPLALLADPGLPVAGPKSSGWQFALGFSDARLGGWSALASSLGLPALAPAALVAVLLAPIAVLALLALFLRGSVRATLALVLALLGFVTAVASAQVSLTSVGASPVSIWPGSGLSLYWFGLTGAAVLGLGAIGRFGTAPSWVAMIALAVAVAPVVAAVPLGTSTVSAGSPSSLPAYVTAESGSNPRVGTLQLVPQPGGGVAAQVLRGSGSTLDAQSTLYNTRQSSPSDQHALTTLAGNLASSSGLDPRATLHALGIDFVLLARPATTSDGVVSADASATSTRAATALDANPRLAQVGATSNGQLWSVSASGPLATGTVPADPGGWIRPVVYVAFGIVFGLALLLSIPTGRAERGVLRRPSAAEIGAATTRADVGADPEPDPDHDPDLPTDGGDDQGTVAVPPGDAAAGGDALPTDEQTQHPDVDEPEQEPDADPADADRVVQRGQTENSAGDEPAMDEQPPQQSLTLHHESDEPVDARGASHGV